MRNVLGVSGKCVRAWRTILAGSVHETNNLIETRQRRRDRNAIHLQRSPVKVERRQPVHRFLPAYVELAG
ncbi:hypothetical protein K0M31_005098 [Melipona bicolor]|uniref:Uncharacterized protein n=1 Tax=Melipona bicolor TaxID=60889 RepID=A0AA40FX30_9HYME|nr:hypothetical protein K0M31_005098 [Melipona bicolor]